MDEFIKRDALKDFYCKACISEWLNEPTERVAWNDEP